MNCAEILGELCRTDYTVQDGTGTAQEQLTTSAAVCEKGIWMLKTLRHIYYVQPTLQPDRLLTTASDRLR